ncbi:MAG: CPBP family intramembrane metalloprotease, partial [Bacteroidales bacterium]|nr:CPBP family intramembrane metalloprotease [Bacteroidales bacterium]
MLIFSSLGVILIGFVFQLLGLFMATLFYDVSMAELLQSNGAMDQNVISAIKLLQIIGALGTFVFSSLLISFFYTGSWVGYFQSGREINWKSAFLLMLVMVAALPFVNFLTDINQRFEIPFEGMEQYFRQMEERTEELMMTLVKADHIGALLVNLFMIALIPAVGEELVFRGLIQRHLTDLFRNAHVAIVVAAVIFSLVHFQIYSFLPRFFLGLILGYAFYYGKSIWYPIIAHLVNNTLGVLFYYFYMKELAGDSLEEIGTMEM